ncbi:MAG TPA: 50S ribosomal protein L35 [Nitrospiraceae bacterium]|nr:50S ribosomal protein L35 [Nitrospiraceae bacterium]
MPKLKTNRGAAKRLKVTGTGKIVRRKAGKRHLLVTKNASRMRSLTGAVQVAKENIANVKRLLPYGGK